MLQLGLGKGFEFEMVTACTWDEWLWDEMTVIRKRVLST